MTYLFPNYKRRELELVQGEGNYLWTSDGRKLLDLTSGIGVMGLGYQPQVLKDALLAQVDLLWHTPNLYTNTLQEEVATLLGEKGDYRVYFCNSGTEANEAALKLMRKATGKDKIITFKQSFHGRTFGSMSATAQEKIKAGFGALVPGFVHVPYNDLAAFAAALDEETAGVLLEVIQGEGGIIPAETAWLQGVAQLCQEAGVLLAVDEIQTGLGRTGYFFACEGAGIEPDIITLAKALGNGLPVGAMLGKAAIADAFSAGSHGSTFGGNKLALSVAKEVINVIQEEDFLAAVRAKGEYFQTALNEQLADRESVVAVRGQGLMLGIEITGDPQAVLSALEEAGVLALTAGTQVVRLLPPLTITYAEIDTAVAALAAVLK